MASRWERLGEVIGYGLAAVVLGPKLAAERRAKRALRQAYFEFSRERDPVVFRDASGALRRGVRIATPEGPLAAEISLVVKARRARIAAEIDALPRSLDARVSRAPWELRGARLRLGEPVAQAGPVRVDAARLDAETATSLATAVAKSPLAAVSTFEIALQHGRAEIDLIAPVTAAEWLLAAEGLHAVAEWARATWQVSYRS